MKIKMGGDTFTLNEDVMLNELRDILYETGKVQMNSINKQMAIYFGLIFSCSYQTSFVVVRLIWVLFYIILFPKIKFL